MKAIAATTEAKPVEPGLSPRAERGVAGFGFDQLFALTGLDFPEAVITQGEDGTQIQTEDRIAADFSVLALIEAGRSQLGLSPLDGQVPDVMVADADQPQPQPIPGEVVPIVFAGSTDAALMPWLAPVGPEILATDAGDPTKLGPVSIDPAMVQNIRVAMSAPIAETPLEVQITADAARDLPGLTGQAALLPGETGQDALLPDIALAAHLTAKSPIHSVEARQQASLTQAPQIDPVLPADTLPADLKTLPQQSEVIARGMDGASKRAERGPDLGASSLHKPGEDVATAPEARSPLPQKPLLPIGPTLIQDSALLAPLVRSGKQEGPRPADTGDDRLDLATASTRVVSALAGMPAKQGKSGGPDGPISEKSAALFAAEAASRAESVQPDMIQAATERAEGFSSASAGARAPVVSTPTLAPLPAALPFSATLNMRQADWGKQLVGHIERMVASGSQRIELSLRPKNLGEIQVLIGMRGEQTTVQIMTETAAAARLLHGGEDRLAQILDQSGYRLSGFSAQEHGSGAQGGQQGQHGHSSPRRNRPLAEAAQREETSEAVATSIYQAGRNHGSGINMLA